MSDPVNQSEQQPLENAVDIIERFGGIRPMAAKVNIAVTTIQGWKKRGVIPANRVEAVIAAARSHSITIDDLTTKVANKAVVGEILPVQTNDNKQSEVVETKQDIVQPSKPAPARHDEIYRQIQVDQANIADTRITPPVQSAQARARQADADRSRADKTYTELTIEKSSAVPKGAFVAMAVGVLVLAAVAGVMMPKFKAAPKQEQAAQEVPVQVAEAPVEANEFKGLVPEDWQKRLETLKEETSRVAQSATETAQAVHEDLLGENAGTTQERLVKLEKYVENVVGENAFSGLTDRFAQMSGNITGQEYLDNSMNALHGMFIGESGVQLSEEAMNAKLDAARQADPSLNEALGGVPRQDLKAAAMLLAMTQVRDTLNRSNVPFEKDLQTLMGMVGNDNQELMTSLEKLAPSAKEGILTPTGLSDEFKKIAGDALSASLRGEDVELVDRARAKMNDIFKVEKEGELLSGTRTQQVIDQAQKDIEAGNIQSAINFLREQLDAKELEPLRPWIRQAESVLSASSVKEAIQKAIDLQGGQGYLGGSQILQKSE